MKSFVMTKNGVPTIQVNDPSDLDEYELIDVRRPDEWNGELAHIKNAKLLTLGRELNEFLQQTVDKNKKILFICRSGARSGQATEQALSCGFKNVFNMDGGMIYWNEKGFPVIKEQTHLSGAERNTMTLRKNIHPVERGIRIALGLVLMSLAFVGPENKWFLLGIIPLLTGFIGWCPPYQLLGISTCSKK